MYVWIESCRKEYMVKTILVNLDTVQSIHRYEIEEKGYIRFIFQDEDDFVCVIYDDIAQRDIDFQKLLTSLAEGKENVVALRQGYLVTEEEIDDFNQETE